MNTSKIKVYLFVCTAIVLWGLSFVWTNQLLEHQVPVFTLVCTRMIFSGVFLFGIGLAFRKLQHIKKEDIKWFFLMASMEPFLYFIGETFGMKLTASPSLSSIIVSTIPLFSLMGAMLFNKEKLGKVSILGILITLPGLLMVVFGNSLLSSLSLTNSPTGTMGWGVALLFLAVFSAVFYAIIVKKIADSYNSFTITTYQMSIGAILFLPFMLIFDVPKDGWGSIFLDAAYWRPILILAILCSSLSFILYISALRELGISRANTFNALIPVVTASFCYFAGIETFDLIQLCGAVVVVSGVIMAQHNRS